jgi:hypothetical protein
MEPTKKYGGIGSAILLMKHDMVESGLLEA